MMEQFLSAFKQPTQGHSKKSKQTSERHIPWVEKYRPKTVDDVAHQDEVVAVLKKCLQGADLPNLLFYGPPGTGKTSTILAAARELFGPAIYSDRVLELNASDERGIQVVRAKVKKFAQLTAAAIRPDGKPCPPYKIVILDEADSMTNPAQAALRRTMEKESRTTRFCLICNYVSRIIEPITSRCAKFRFKPLGDQISLNRLRSIAESESVNIDDETLSLLIELSSGDLRKSTTLLQTVSRLHKDGSAVTASDVTEVAGVVEADTFLGLTQAVTRMAFEDTDSTLQAILCEGYSGHQLVNQLHEFVLFSTSIPDKQKAIILEKLAVSDQQLLEGGDEYLQVMAVCCTMIGQLMSV